MTTRALAENSLGRINGPAKEGFGDTHSLVELTRRNVEAIAQLEQAATAHRRIDDRVADAVTRFVGSMPFVYVHIGLFGLWLLLNRAPYLQAWRFDPFPYPFLTFVVSLEAIFLSTFSLIIRTTKISSPSAAAI